MKRRIEYLALLAAAAVMVFGLYLAKHSDAPAVAPDAQQQPIPTQHAAVEQAYAAPEAIVQEAPQELTEPVPLPPKTPAAKPTKGKDGTPLPPQFVLLSFDGSQSLPMWEETTNFARELKVKGMDLHFTYFVSGVYFLDRTHRWKYDAPGFGSGSSSIGFATNQKEISVRIKDMDQAIADGHEIASHANGHFNGAKWTEAQWDSELSQFRTLLTQAASNNSSTLPMTLDLPGGRIDGFRAPLLATDAALYPALKSNGYRYDASGIGKPEEWPKKLPSGIWEIPLARIKYSTTTKSLLSMDYNFYFKQTQAVDMAKRGTPEWQRLKSEMLDSYMNYFLANYAGTRAPVVIGHHFSTWNDGAYWEAMKQFAELVCGQPEVRCTTFSELTDYLDTQGN